MDENPRIGDLRKKIEKDPGSRLFAQLAEELRKEGRLEEAIQVAYDGLAKHPAYPSARLTLARALLDSGRAPEAHPELEQIVKAAPDNILAGRLLAEALDALGDLPAALKQFERTLMFSPGDKTMVARVADIKGRLQAPPPSTAAPPATPSSIEVASVAVAPAESPSIFPSEAPAPSIVADQAGPAPSLFGDEAATTPPSLFAEEAQTAPTLPEDVTSASAAPAALEVPAEASTIPFALSDAPADFSESSASLPALQFEESAVDTAVPEPPPPIEAPPAPAFSLALDRDLASGTISPGAFNMAELQRHFEAIAAAERAAAEGHSAPAPVAPTPVMAAPVVEDSLPGGGDEFQTPNIDTADTMSITVPDGGFGVSPAVDPEPIRFDAPSVTESAMPLETEAWSTADSDLGSQTLPLTSLTLADLYLQQGLKAEAAAVLSQVVRDEPSNEQARSRLSVVSAAVAEGLVEPSEHFADQGAASEAPRPSRPRTRAEISAATIFALKAFQGAAEREARDQRATEMSAR